MYIYIYIYRYRGAGTDIDIDIYTNKAISRTTRCIGACFNISGILLPDEVKAECDGLVFHVYRVWEFRRLSLSLPLSLCFYIYIYVYTNV